MVNNYYEQELINLRELSNEFAARNPAIASFLGSSSAADPDVERLLEGTAFLSGLIRQRLEDDFPEFIQPLAQIIFPHFLCPVPCMTMIQYRSASSAQDSYTIPAGTPFYSVPVDGKKLKFSSSFDVEVQPINLRTAYLEEREGQTVGLNLRFLFTNIHPSAWDSDYIRLFLGDALPEAKKWFLLLLRYVSEIRIVAHDGTVTRLPSEALQMAGFDPDLQLLPLPAGVHPASRLAHEYFSLPEKFLFVDIKGFSQWQNRGDSDQFEVKLIFSQVPDWIPNVSQSSFLLNVTPAVNLFPHSANPISINHRLSEYHLHASESRDFFYGTYSVDKVTAKLHDGTEQVCMPFNAFTDKRHIAYSTCLRPSITKGDYDHLLSLPYRNKDSINVTMLSVELTCHNGRVPESLRLGDVRIATDTTPSSIDFTNISAISPYCSPKADSQLLWKLLSHLNSNYLATVTPELLKEMLSLYIPSRENNNKSHLMEQYHIDAIESVTVTGKRKFVKGIPVDGSEIYIKCKREHFSNMGSLFFFGSMIDEFFACSALMNTFVKLIIEDLDSGEVLEWPEKIGQQRLL